MKKSNKIYITGDVHHTTFPSWEHRRGFNKVFKYVKDWCNILEENGMSGTLFVTGKCFEERPAFWKKISETHVLGGHTYSAMDQMIPFMKTYNKTFFGSELGPKYVQEQEIESTELAAMKAGVILEDWRTHAYAKIDYGLLVRHGFKRNWDIITDKDITGPYQQDGLVFMPQTFPEDHSNIRHLALGDRRKKKLMHPSEFVNLVREKFKLKSRLQILQLHPTCQRCIDDFEMFKEIVREARKVI